MSVDVDRDGIIWLVSNGILFRYDPVQKQGKRIASGPDWHLAHLTKPVAVRLDAQGNVYVIENGERDEAARISVYDRSGRFVRVFGRGNKAPNPARDHPRWEGQISSTAADLVTGPDGRVYIADPGFPGAILIFRPF